MQDVEEDPYPPAAPIPVRGLLDSEGTALFLGIGRVRIRSWQRRKHMSSAGLPALFPDPVAEMNGGGVWDVDELLKFKSSREFKDVQVTFKDRISGAADSKKK